MFSKTGNTISIVDFENPEKNRQELEPWFGIVFSLADGQTTIEEMHNRLGESYTAGPPSDLMRTLLSVIERLVEAKLIVLTDVKTELPYYLTLPYEMLDLETAKKLLAEDRSDIN
ncbi:MAG: hypothetical protein QNK23_11570 [Crocinitomicaceae bacterium]|nr:hypothetical protein [Crocinitomicaceae bacterium]